MCRSRQEAKIHPRPRRGCKVCFQSGSQIVPAKTAGYGNSREAARRRSNGAAGGCAVRGNSWSHPLGGSRGSERAGNRGLTVGTAGRCAMRGNSRTHQRLGGIAEEEMRGNPEIHRLRCRRIARFEATRSSIAGTAEDASREATRGRIGKLNGKMHDPSNLWFTAIKAPETPVSGALIFAARALASKSRQP